MKKHSLKRMLFKTIKVMEKITYLDNAATTALSPEVLDAMLPYLREHYGNPSSVYAHGRSSRSAIEHARKSVASLLGVKPGSIYFTSGGTESNNTAICSAVRDLGCTHIITSAIEHHAVLHTVEHYSVTRGVSHSFVHLTDTGEIDYADLELQLSIQANEGKKCLVSLMHANNEIGTILDLERVGGICNAFGAIFHSDCVQSIGHYPLDLAQCGMHFASAAGHKFHGPKGTGILYVAEGVYASPLIYGGGQERNMRAGTENVYGIIGFAKALELAMAGYLNDRAYISGLKSQLQRRLVEEVPGVTFNNTENSLYTVLSVCFPSSLNDLIIMQFDMNGICVSGGSACSSGEDSDSHVIKALYKAHSCATVRFSFSKYNTSEDIEKAVEVAKTIFHKSILKLA